MSGVPEEDPAAADGDAGDLQPLKVVDMGWMVVQWPGRCAECQRPILPGFKAWWSGLSLVHRICKPFRERRLEQRQTDSRVAEYWENLKDES